MDHIEAIFTKRKWNPVSFVIRCATPVSITTPAPASHVIAVDGDFALEAVMFNNDPALPLHKQLKGRVRRVPLELALHGATVVKRVKYEAPHASMGLAWMRATAERGADYDLKGAFGLGLAPSRNWQDDSDWFCFEFFANGLAKAGRAEFVNNAHVNAQMLMALRPAFRVYVP